MPIYEFSCTCGKTYQEFYRNMSQAPASLICTCGEEAKRVISKSGFILKGDCWYRDGYTHSKEKGSENKGDKKSTN